MARKFKPGDWVKFKGKLLSPKMEVIKYIPKKDVFGVSNNDTYLECVWYENGSRKSEVFHQNTLVKLVTTAGLYQT